MKGEEKMKFGSIHSIEDLIKKLHVQIIPRQHVNVGLKILMLVLSLILSGLLIAVIPYLVWNYAVCFAFNELPEITLIQSFIGMLFLNYLKYIIKN